LSLLEECTRWCERALASLDAATRGTRQEMSLQEAFALSSMYATGNNDQVPYGISWSGDFPTASDYAARLIEYAGRHSLEVYRVCGHGLKGAVAIARNQLAIRRDLLQVALDTLTAGRRGQLSILLTSLIGALADGLCKCGQLEGALLTINQAIDHATDSGRHSTWLNY
jgi:hypothetical protein